MSLRSVVVKNPGTPRSRPLAPGFSVVANFHRRAFIQSATGRNRHETENLIR